MSGTARGADKLGERFAEEKRCHLKQFPADWNQYGKAAGYLRNEQMARYADACVVFMEEQGTNGSQHMIDIARRSNLEVHVIRY